MLPNVLICMAVKLEQLKYIIKKHFAHEFQILNREGSMDDLLEAMSERYLEKLVPHERRFYLPDLEVNFYRSLVIYRDVNDKGGTQYNSIREAVLTLIFQKTRFLFYNTKGKTSYIVPRNLRELRTIISLLFNMQDYWEGDVRPEYNKQLFLKYFFETWIPNNLSKRNQIIIQALRDSEVVSRNKVLVNFLALRLGADEKEVDFNKLYPGLSAIVHDQNKPYNISISDVQMLLDELEIQCIANSDNLKLIFAIKTLYSVWLYQYYDELTATLEIDKASLPEVFKSEFMSDVSNYKKLIGGSFINDDINNIIPPDIKSNSRALRVIDGSVLNVLLNELSKVQANQNDISVTLKEEDRESAYKISVSLAVQLVEFFALTISRMSDSKKRPYRMLSEVYYDFDASPNNKNYLFDLMSCMYNLLDIPQAYRRFNFLEGIAKKTKDSLYNQLQGKYKNRLASKVSIRNMEVLDQFILHLQKHRPQGSSNDIEVLSNFFNSAGTFEIYTYDAETDKNHYKIAFEFLKDILGNLLLEIDKQESGRKIFNAIFSGNSISSTDIIKREININIGLYKNKRNGVGTIKRKLDDRNPEFINDQEYINLKRSLFDKPYYTYNMAMNLLQILQKRFNG